jgi:glyoxylase-like metal-dependent hydrolase (beta-lactamase superfamily II)
MKRKVHKISLVSTIGQVNVFLLEGDELVMIDSGDGTNSSMKKLSDELETLGFELNEISMIINTHEHIEHFGGNATIKDVSGARILAHKLAAPLIEDMRKQMPSKSDLMDIPEEISSSYRKFRFAMYEDLKTTNVDVRLQGNESILIDDSSLKVIYTPGHTRGHICIYEEEDEILFAGDMVIENGTPDTGALPGQYGDMTDFLNSLHRLKDLKIKRLLQSHGEEVSDPYKKIEDTIQSKLIRERELLQVLEGSGKTITQLINIIYGEGKLPRFMYYGTVLAYLEKLKCDGKVKRDGEYYRMI